MTASLRRNFIETFLPLSIRVEVQGYSIVTAFRPGTSESNGRFAIFEMKVEPACGETS
jgi:hypothetical protein